MRTTDVAGGRGNNKHSTLNMRFLVKLLHSGHRDANITHRTFIERYNMLQYIYNHTHSFKTMFTFTSRCTVPTDI